MKLQTLHDVFVEQVADLYSAERQLVSALPSLADAAADVDLSHAFEEHLDQTRTHVDRLERIFETLHVDAPPETCAGMRGLLEEGRKVREMPGNPAPKDAALIAAAQRIEHYEIAAYGTSVQLARQLGLPAATTLLQQTLDEESAADRRLTKLATGGLFGSGINDAADRVRA